MSTLVCFLAAAAAPTPLYAIYESHWRFSPITLTVAYGIYAGSLLAALLIVGSLSDHIGRRPVLITAIGLQAVVMLVFATAAGVPQLLAARVLQGLSTGAALSALGAALVDLNKAGGTIANAAGGLAGTALGALAAGVLVAYLPAPEQLVYLLLFAILLAQGLGVVLMAETAAAQPGALRSLRPRFALGAATRAPMLLATPVLVAVWALAGYYGSLAPTLVSHVIGSDSPLFGGLALFVLAGTASLTVLIIRTVAPRTVMVIATLSLMLGVGVTLLAVGSNSTAGLFIGTAIAGVGFGSGVQAGMRTVLMFAPSGERAGVLSIIYVVSYLGIGVPSVIAGFRVERVGVETTAREFGVVVIVLAAIALVGLAWRPRRSPAAATGRPATEPDVLALAGCGPPQSSRQR